jgi:putative component of toxin-antitoxin plasmid stabilization module
MVEVLKTSVFDAWLSDLKDRQAVAHHGPHRSARAR